MSSTDQMDSKPMIVFVDDDPAVLEALQRIVRRDFRVKTFTNSIEALSWIRLNPTVAIIASDYKMPAEDGIEFMRKCRSVSPYSVRVILSGQMEIDKIAVAINQAEIHRFFLKPWENDYLRLQLLECLQLHASLVEKDHLKKLAITDPLTGLFNHRYFQSEIRAHLDLYRLQKISSLSLLMIDVDHFKKFNDEFGHPEGDRLLSELAHKIKIEVEDLGIVCRYGGEEFALILPNQNLVESVKIAENLRAAVSRQRWVGPTGNPTHSTVSIGLAALKNIACPPEEFIFLADQNLYQAKRQGRNQCVASEVDSR